MRVLAYARGHLRLLLLSGLVITAALAAGGWLYMREAMRGCTSAPVQTISGPGTRYAKVFEEACDGFGAYGAAWVVVGSHETGQRVTVFKYYLDDSNPRTSLRDALPRVAWSARDRLNISVSAVGSVAKKVAKANGIRIRYSIGEIAYR